MADTLIKSILKNIFLVPINFYQKFISPYTPKSCRYYPSCSEYARQQFLNNNILYALFFSTKRILRCNQLFAGGIDYPIVKYTPPKVLTFNSKQKLVWWFVPLDHNLAYVIKAF